MTSRPLRADARRNRQQVVDAAREAFAERGLDASLDEIAKRAGVGNATLYRRFPSRRDLVAAVFTETMREVARAADDALVVEDAWEAFRGHLRFLCRLQAGDRALADLITSTVSGDAELERVRRRAYAGLVRLIDRAKAAGELRPDFTHEDVFLVLMANAGLLERTADAAPSAWNRHLSFVLDGLRVPAAAGRANPPSPLPRPAPAPSRRQLLAAMRAMGDRHGCA